MRTKKWTGERHRGPRFSGSSHSLILLSPLKASVSIRETNKVCGPVSPDAIFWPMAGDGEQWGLEDKMILCGTYESTYFNLFYLYV